MTFKIFQNFVLLQLLWGREFMDLAVMVAMSFKRFLKRFRQIHGRDNFYSASRSISSYYSHDGYGEPPYSEALYHSILEEAKQQKTAFMSCFWASQRHLIGNWGKQDAGQYGPFGLIQQGSFNALREGTAPWHVWECTQPDFKSSIKTLPPLLSLNGQLLSWMGQNLSAMDTLPWQSLAQSRRSYFYTLLLEIVILFQINFASKLILAD